VLAASARIMNIRPLFSTKAALDRFRLCAQNR
jgi:hypothetical protein